MYASEFFASRFLSAADLKERSCTVTIDRFESVELNDKEGPKRRPVIYFQGKEKGMVLNKTNAFYIASLHGDDMNGWIGKSIELYPDRVLVGNEMKPCVRVRAASQQAAQASQQSYAQRRDPPPPA